MKTTKIFKSGNSLAVRLPKEFQLHGSKVAIFKRGHDIVLREIPQNLKAAFILLTQLEDISLTEKRIDDIPQKREPLE